MKNRNVICKNVVISERSNEYIICEWKCANCLNSNKSKIYFNKERKLIAMCNVCHNQNVIDIMNK